MEWWNVWRTKMQLGMRLSLGLAALVLASCRVGGMIDALPEPPKKKAVSLALLSPTANPLYSRNNELTLEGLCEPGVRIRISGSESLEKPCDQNGTFRFIIWRENDGVYPFVVTEITDEKSERSLSPLVWIRKSSVPMVSILSPPPPADGVFKSAASQLVLNGACETGATVRLYEGDARQTVLDTQPCVASGFQMTISRQHDSEYLFQLEQTDPATNSSIREFRWKKSRVSISLANSSVEVDTTQVVRPLGGSGTHTLTLVSSPSGATLSYNDQSGVYTYRAGLIAAKSDTLQVRDSDGFESTVSIDTHAAAADHLTINAGNAQVGLIDQLFSQPLQVVMRDRHGNPKANEVVLFHPTAGDVIIRSSPIQTTDALGRAQVSVQAGPSQLFSRVSVSRLTGVGNGPVLPDLALTGGARVEFTVQAESRGTGGFGTRLSLGTSTPEFMIQADLNADSRQDLVISSPAAQKLFVFKQKNDGSFGDAQEVLNVCSAPQGVVAADFNGDSRQDLAVACPEGKVVVLFQDLEGNFQESDVGSSFSVPGGPKMIKAVDFNHDSKIDLVAVGSSSPSLLLLENRLNLGGSGEMAFLNSLTSALSLSGTPHDLRAADITGDGIVDLILTTSSDGDFGREGKLEVWKGVGSAGTPSVPPFEQRESAISLGLSELPFFLEIADLTGDNQKDVAILNQASGEISVLLGADGTFLAGEVPPVEVRAGALSMDWADLNGDQRPDLVVVGADEDGSWIQRFFANPLNGGFHPASELKAWSVPKRPLIGDWNNDGVADLAISSGSSRSLELIYGHGDGRQGTGFLVGASPSDAVSGDFNRDGKPDLAVVSPNLKTIRLLRGAKNGLFTSNETQLETGAGPAQPLVADLNGDGWDDLVVLYKEDSSVGIFMNSTASVGGALSFSSTVISVGANATLSQLTIGDWNKDGKLDFAVIDSSLAKILVFHQSPDNTWTPVSTAITTCSSPFLVYHADFNKDGILDLIVLNKSGTAALHRGTDQGTFQPAQNLVIASSISAAAVADFDGDGDSDLTVLVPSVSEDDLGKVYSYANSGTGEFTLTQGSPVSAGGTGIDLKVADINGDGRLDLLVSSGAEGAVRLIPGQSGAGIRFTAGSPIRDYGLTLGRMGTADFNRDGAPDLWVLHPISGQIDVQLAIPKAQPN